ncbi:hypothetical protein ACWIDW_08830 [Microbacterium sp. NPDC055312]
MTLTHPDARSWARARSAAEEPRLGMLEAVAFQQHPDLVATFGSDGAAVAEILTRRTQSPARRGSTAVLAVLAILGVIAPVAGMTVLGAESYLIDRVPAATSVPVAAAAFAVGAVMLLVTGVLWLRSGARWSGLVCGIAVVSAIAAGFATASMPTVAARDDYPLDQVMLTPVWGALALGALLAVAVLLRFRVRPAEAATEPTLPVTITDRERAARSVAALPADQRHSIQHDRDTALQILHERGFLDDTALEQALAAPLGTLFTLDPIRRSSP